MRRFSHDEDGLEERCGGWIVFGFVHTLMVNQSSHCSWKWSCGTCYSTVRILSKRGTVGQASDEWGESSASGVMSAMSTCQTRRMDSARHNTFTFAFVTRGGEYYEYDASHVRWSWLAQPAQSALCTLFSVRALRKLLAGEHRT